MKKIFSIILIVFVLISSLVIPVSAEEDNYTAVVYLTGVISYKENSETIVGTSITLTGVEDFVRGKIVFSFNPVVLKGAPEKMKDVSTGAPKRFINKYETGNDYVKICFEKNNVASVISDTLSVSYIFQSLSVGEHNLSVEVVAYNDKGEKTEYDVVFAFDLYEKTVADFEIPVVDRSNLKLKNNFIYLDHKTKPSALIEKFDGADVAVVVPVTGILDEKANIPNGAYLVALYKGFVADRIHICVMEDVNCDGKITAADARLALRNSAKLENLTVIQRCAADMNADGSVTAADARLILRKAAGLD